MRRNSSDRVLAAVYGGDLAELQSAIRNGDDVNGRDRGGRTPLANAVIDGRADMVDLLLAAAANVNASDAKGYTPLHFAALNHVVTIARALIAANAVVDAKDAWGNTPLSTAVFESRGRADVVHALLEAGADQHLKNDSGVSPRGLVETIANYDVLSMLGDSSRTG
jgi:uncharacterized protein